MRSSIYKTVSFADIPGWTNEFFSDALNAFGNCHEALEIGSAADDPICGRLRELSGAARDLDADNCNAAAARHFFEENFVPHRVVHDHADGLLTGYYEPVLRGSRNRTAVFGVPIYRRPPGLVDLVDNTLRGASGEQLTHALQKNGSLVTCPERAAIEQGQLAGQDLELLYLADAVDTFFLHVQGSGLIELDSGDRIRVGYAGKNGYSYTSVGRVLVDTGVMAVEDVTLASLADWLRADPVRGQEAMWWNESFIFFEELGRADDSRPCGVRNIPLVAHRSLAVDASYHRIGLPIFVSSETLTHATQTPAPLRRLMIAQDVGSAITGPERGDIFFGTGAAAGDLAGRTKHRGNFFVLLPKDVPTE
ncbi:MAG: murein transglycosylase A [Hyphomicrobiaceae bacterium]